MKKMTTHFRAFLRLTMVGAIAALSFACAPKKASFEELRIRYFDRITGQGNDLSDSIIVKRLAAMDAGVEQMWSSMNKAADRQYLWNDRDAQDDSISPFRPASITSALGRLGGMAVAYATPGSKYHKDPRLLKDATEAMEWMYANKWSPKHPMYGNWWDWIIGMPFSVNNFITALYDELTPEQRTKYIEALDYYAPGVTYQGASTGANKIWQCYSMILRGILSQNAEKIKMGVSGIDSEFKYVDNHDGFYRDGSFLQHQWHSYTGGYGAGLLRDMVHVIQAVEGSKWAVDKSHVQMMGEWVESAYLPLIYQGAMMEMSRGREIARQGAADRNTGHSILISSYNVANLSTPELKERILSRVKYEMQADKYRDIVVHDIPTWQLSEVKAFLANDKIQPQEPALGVKQFPMMDRVVYRGNGFGVALAMSSSRIENYESIDTENMMAWHIGDGMTYIYNGDQSHFTDQYWSTVNWYRLPGTTVDADQQHEVKSLIFGEGVLYADGYKSPHSWVGGSSIKGLFGITGMWFKDEKSSLEAKKSWFMAGDRIVCLGAGINSTDNRTIETIIDSRKVNGTPQISMGGEVAVRLDSLAGEVQSEVSWAHFVSSTSGTDMGYYFPEKTNVKFLHENRTGSWRAFTKYGDPTPVNRPYFTCWFDHGKSPQNATYAYVLLPGMNARQTQAYAMAADVKILSNTPQIQAVQCLQSDVIGINFWEAAELQQGVKVKVDHPASVIFENRDEKVVIGVSDPTMLLKESITLEFDLYAKAPRVNHPDVEVVSVSPLKIKVNVKGAMGATRTIVLDK